MTCPFSPPPLAPSASLTRLDGVILLLRLAVTKAMRDPSDGLVGQDHRRLLRQRPRDGHALLLAARERRGAVVGLLDDAHALERVDDEADVGGVLARARGGRDVDELDAVIVRPTNLYGPGQARDKLIPVAVRKLCSNELVPLYGDGKQIREWVHVEDVARLLGPLALEATDVSLLPTSAKWGIVHAGSGQRGSNRLVADTLATRCEERGLRHPGTDRTTFVQDRPGHDFAYGLDSSLTLAECGWKAVRSFLSERDLDELINAYGVPE
jgi:hypothetical protein